MDILNKSFNSFTNVFSLSVNIHIHHYVLLGGL